MLNRRRFLTLLPLASILAIFGGCKRQAVQPENRKFVLGPADQFPLGLTIRSLERIAVLRDDGGLAAMSILCTHQVCLLREAVPDESAVLVCPCHGSRFNRSGSVLNGPAEEALPFFRLSHAVDGGLIVDLSEQVPSEWRLRI